MLSDFDSCRFSKALVGKHGLLTRCGVFKYVNTVHANVASRTAWLDQMINLGPDALEICGLLEQIRYRKLFPAAVRHSEVLQNIQHTTIQYNVI